MQVFRFFSFPLYYLIRGNVYVIYNFRYPTWTYNCVEGKCVKQLAHLVSSGNEGNQGSENKHNQSLTTCKMLCGEKASLWPYPTGIVDLSNTTFNFLPVNVWPLFYKTYKMWQFYFHRRYINNFVSLYLFLLLF